MKQAIDRSLQAALKAGGARVEEPSRNAWLLKAVPVHDGDFSKARTNLLIVGSADSTVAAYCDEDLCYTGRRAAVAAAFTSDVRQGWRRLQLHPPMHDRQAALNRVLAYYLQSPIGIWPARKDVDGIDPRPCDSAPGILGPTARAVARVVDSSAPSARSAGLFGATADRLVSAWERSAGRQIPVVWDASPTVQSVMLDAAARRIAATLPDATVLDVCCPSLAAGCATAAQLDASLNHFLIEVREVGQAVLVMREMDALVVSRSAAAILVNALRWREIGFIGGVVEDRALWRMSSRHPDVFTVLLPIRVGFPSGRELRRAIAEVFSEAGVADVGGLTARALCDRVRRDALNIEDAMEMAYSVANAATAVAAGQVFPDDIWMPSSSHWEELGRFVEDRDDEGGE